MELLKRKIDDYLMEWKSRDDRLPLIVKGALQVGKTKSIQFFASKTYEHVVEINFALQPAYTSIFNDGFEVSTILKNISLINPSFVFVPHKTLIFFDELQDCPKCATSLKPFKLDGRYDVICSGSMMGVNYHEIELNSVGFKEDFEMYSLDFEEFLWAKGYSSEQIEDLYQHMNTLTPFSALEMDIMIGHFRDYMVIGGMPAIVDSFVKNGTFSGTLRLQRQIIADYEEDITKYAKELKKVKTLSVYRKIPTFLGRDNKKFQITHVERGARSREYEGVTTWLHQAGIIHICHCLDQPELPLGGNYDPDNFKLYFSDTGLLIGALDEEAQIDLRENKNFNTYKGAIYENIVAEMLVKQGYALYFWRNSSSTLEIDFFIRDADSLIPIEVKAQKSPSPSLVRLVTSSTYPQIRYGIKLSSNNIGFNGQFYTFPYFLTFLLKRFLREHPHLGSSIP